MTDAHYLRELAAYLSHMKDVDREKLRAIADRIEATEKDAERLRKRAANQRTELRRLNKYLGPHWFGFRRGIAMESECRLRGIMNAAFGHKQVRAAEHAAIDAVMKEKPASAVTPTHKPLEMDEHGNNKG